MDVSNDKSSCRILISNSRECLTAYPSLSNIRIAKRVMPDGAWRDLHDRVVSIPVDADVLLADYSVANGVSYEYAFYYTEVGVETFVSTLSIAANFDAVFVGNANAQFIAAVNATFSHVRKTNTTYVQPYHRQFPQSVKNGIGDYHTGTVSALFTPFDEGGEPVFDDNVAYRKALSDFLTDGQPKLLKTIEGYMWMVEVDAEISTSFDGFVENRSVGFNWTEIASAADSDVVVVLV